MTINIRYHGRIMYERYRVKSVDQIKCWTIFGLEGSQVFQLRRSHTDQNLVERIVGKEIKVTRIEHPPLPNSRILDVFYLGLRVCPYHQTPTYGRKNK